MVTAATGGKRQGMVARRPNHPAGNGDSGGGAVGKPFAKARQLQRGLYVAAKRSRDRRFHALFDRICRSDVLAEAWERVRLSEACMPHVKTIGKPYAGNPHVRFERGPQETEPVRHRA